MANYNVELTEHWECFVREGVESGQYASESDVICDGLRLLEQRKAEDKAKLEWLRSAVQEGLDDIERGDVTVVDSPEEITALIQSLRP